ncbi:MULTISPECIES: helix-turn-helix domain-containing protein [Streptomyces]
MMPPVYVPRDSERCTQHTAMPRPEVIDCRAVQGICVSCKRHRRWQQLPVPWKARSCGVGGPVPVDPFWSTPEARELVEQRRPGAFIRLGREHRSWTLATLGDRLGCSPATISRLERRGHVVDLTLIHRAAQAVGVPVHVLVSSLAPPVPKVPTATRVTASSYAEGTRCAAVRCSPLRPPLGRSPC